MRILVVVHQYLPNHRAGTEVYAHSLASHLSRRHDVLVYAHEWALDGGATRAVNDTYERVNVRRVAALLEKRARSPWSVFRLEYHNPAMLRDLEHILDTQPPDIVHVQHLRYMPVALLSRIAARGIPVVMTLHDYWAICPNAQRVRPGGTICERSPARLACGLCAVERMGVPALRWAAPLFAPAFLERDATIRHALNHVRRLITPSAFLRDRLVANGLPGERTVVLENGLDLARIATARATPRGALRGHYAYIGSLAWQKGVDVLIRAFGDLAPHGAHLRVWGSPLAFPDYARRLADLAAGCPNVTLEGEADAAAVDAALAWADYLVVPSVWWENSPVTIQEAYAAGVPVIASRIGALEEKVQDGVSGLLFAPGDVADLTRVLRRTIAEPDLLPRLRTGIPPVVPIAEHAARIETLYAEVIAEAQARGPR